MNMNTSDQEKQDQRTISGMEDSTAMTVEFLRARLLAERSVSRSARQRADELAKRVAELEEQLRFVSLQRMRAEKATADVLAILESNGMSDVSEAFDSNSDEDTPFESPVAHKSSKEEENSAGSKGRKNESESGSDFDFSTVHGRSLSWRGRKESPRSLDRYKDPSLRRRSSFASTGSSPRHRSGKSCRRIRCNESRSISGDCEASPTKVDTPDNGAVTTSEDFPNSSNVEPHTKGGAGEIGEEKSVLVEHPLSGHLENGQNANGNELDFREYGSRDMEKALEHQAQLIGRYEAMEKAQREWEDKFRENNNSTPDSCDPGNRSDVTEERYEIKEHSPQPAGTNTNRTRMENSEGDLSNIQPHGILPSHIERMSSPERESRNIPASETQIQDSSFPMGNRMLYQESMGNHYHQPLHTLHHHQHSPMLRDSPGSQFSAIFPSNAGSSLSKGKASGSQNEYSLVPHKATNELGGVLEALKQARQSLQQKLSPLPLLEGGSAGRSIEPSIPNTGSRNKVEIPVGCVGLFRLPTDFSVEGNSRVNLLSPSTRLSLGNCYPDAGVPSVASNPFTTPYLESRPSIPTADQFFTSRSVEGDPRISSQRPYFDPHMDTNLPSSSRYTNTTYPINPSYPDPMPQMPSSFGERFSTCIPSRTAGISPSDNFSFSNNHIRPNMYR